MYLSKLEIFGFKSFAQKTVFRFEDGLTGIVGPNGCGKSNIVDAIRWVLGEQRPSVIRCDRMDNLIFNGTSTRKPLSMSEVSIYIENNRQILPSDYNEIKLTRRLYRSGESAYLMNNENVRLMDINNLFADTGMGADAYSVIELKMVEQILNDNTQERRRLFEEAAGIKKYKTRRKSALNKLETTEKELTRLEDIIAEVQKTVNSLARQVGKARRYHEYKQGLQENEKLLSFLKIHGYQHHLQPLEAEQKEVSQTKNTLGKEVHVKEAELEKLQAQSVETEQTYRTAATALHQQDEAIQERQNRRQLREQKIASIEETINTYQNEIESQKQKIQHLQDEKAELQGKIEDIQQAMNEAQEKYRESANQELEAETNYEQIRKEYQDYMQANLAEIQSSSQLKEEFQKINYDKENLSARLSQNETTCKKLKSEREQKELKLQEMEKSLAGLQSDQQTYQQEYEHLEKAIQEDKNELERLHSEINISEGKLEKARSRRDFLESVIKNYEGFSQSVQYVMSQKTEYGGIVDTLANLVDCQSEYRPALESYLAEVANYLVVEEVDTAQQILRKLRSEGKGRLTLIPLPLLISNSHPNAGELPTTTEQIFPLQEVVTYPESYNKLFNFFFNSVYLVPDLESAIDMREKYPHLTYVTREGEVLEHWGNLTGGSATNGTGLIGRQDQYQQLLKEIEDLDNELNDKQKKLEATRESLNTRETKLQEFAELQKSTQQEIVELEKKANEQKYDLSHISQTVKDIDEEIIAQKEQLHHLEEKENELKPKMQELEEKLKSYKEREKSLQEQQQQAEVRLKELTKATQECQITYLNLSGQEKELQQKIEFVEQSVSDSENYIAEREQRIKDNQSQEETLQKEIEEIDTQLEEAYKERDEQERKKNEVEKQYQELKSSIQFNEGELKKKQRLWNQAKERLQELELRIRELQVKLSSVREHVKEKYGEQALEFDINSLDPSVSINEVYQKIEELNTRIENLGDVNPLAIKEHEKEKERLSFLNSQKDDLLTAREQLLETIQKLNKNARAQFMDTFHKIQTNFQKVFREFFDGGSAELVLVESRDPLEANIDMVVSHKGKKVNTLSLLSAGEKTLTAISLLFAIYLVKPSPFCILDEVDAPLDDVNIARYIQALNQFAKDTQFILVTHNKKTMEATDSIYGITMEEEGVSKVVSVKFD